MADAPEEVPFNLVEWSGPTHPMASACSWGVALVALQWGDIQFGKDKTDSNRFIIVRHNYVRREHTTTKSKKSRRPTSPANCARN